MAFNIAKNGMRMYQPSWQAEPGYKRANRNTVANATSSANTLATNLIGGSVSSGASAVELTMQMAMDRINSEYAAKREQLLSKMV